MSLTVGEHDRLWKGAAVSICNLEASLRRRNALDAAKELYNMLAIQRSEYQKLLFDILKAEGFKYTPEQD